MSILPSYHKKKKIQYNHQKCYRIDYMLSYIDILNSRLQSLSYNQLYLVVNVRITFQKNKTKKIF